MILEKSRTVRRRYQRRKQQVVFSKEELARLERAEERDRRAKKLQEQEKRRVANKKKRLEKEALAREERKKSGLPDPNVKISASQKLLSNFFGMGGGGGGGGGERDKSQSTGEDGGDTEVDTDDSFDDDDALTLFNDEDVLKGINSGGIGNDTPEPSAGKQTEPMLNSQRLSSCGNESKPHIESDQTFGTEKKQTADQLALKPTDANGDKGKQPPATGVKLTSQTTAKVTESDLFADDDDLLEEMVHSGSANISQNTQPTDLYQDAEDVLAGLCTQDFDDDDDDDEEKEEKKEKEKGKEEEERTGQAQVRSQHRASGGDKQQAQQQPLSDLAPTSLNIKNAETTTTTTTTCVQKQQDTSKTTTIHPQTTTTTTSAIDDDEYGSFSFSNEDLLSLGV